MVVDVVGAVRALKVDADGQADIAISASPVYVLPQAEYGRLTGN